MTPVAHASRGPPSARAMREARILGELPALSLRRAFRSGAAATLPFATATTSKLDKRRMRHSVLAGRVAESAEAARTTSRTVRRRKALTDALADAAVDVDLFADANVAAASATVRLVAPPPVASRSTVYGNRPDGGAGGSDAGRRRQSLVCADTAVFSRNFAQFSASTARADGAMQLDDFQDSAAPTTARWQTLRDFIAGDRTNNRVFSVVLPGSKIPPRQSP